MTIVLASERHEQMPFKLRLKKSRRHYDVVSKKVFVVSVELLDKAVVECSLSSDSNGQELFENVCQRIGLHQSEFFGLRFTSKWRRRSPRWLDLEKPVKRQLEKYAAHGDSPSTQLSLGVLYYVGDVALLFDEVARYHYFLQLKSDIVEGSIPCNADEAVILAGYCLQAEFGNHDPIRHTFEYLKDFPLLPKNLCLDAPNLLSQVIAAHAKMVGLVPAAAEQNYIRSVQQLDDYGIEYFPAKDDRGEDALFGVSIVGVVHKFPSSDKSVTFKWSSILNLSNQKRCIVVDHEKSEAVSSRSSQFQMEDSDTAKYIWRLCILQHKFYMRIRSAISRSNDLNTASDTANWRSISMPNLQSYVGYETVSASGGGGGVSYVLHGHHLTGDPRAEYLALSSGAISELPYEVEQQQQQPDEEEIEEEDEADATLYRAIGLSAADVHRGSCGFDPMGVSSSPSGDTVDGLHDHLHQWSRQQQLQQLSAEQLSSRAQLLPTYRPAPDYDTAVRKYGTSQGEMAAAAVSDGHLAQIEASIPSSNGIVVVVENPLMAKSYSHYKNFADLSHADGESSRVAEEDGGQSAISASSYDQLVHELSRLRPPPPYPYGGGQRASASTPDLALERLSLRRLCEVSDAVSRSVVVVGCGIKDDKPSSSNVIVQEEEGDVSSGFEFVRPTIPSAVSSLDSKRSRPKDLRCRSSSTQSAPDPTVVSASTVSYGRTATVGPSQSSDGSDTTSIAANRDGPSCKSIDDARCLAFERKLSEGSVFAEFAAIPRRRPLRGPVDLDCATALLLENASRNRFAVLTYDDNRVRLTPTADNLKGYINASHISVDVGGLERLSYVAAQGPLSNTAADFWQMVWQLDARVIVMLTDVTDEHGAEKCFQYWPHESDAGNVCLNFDHLQVVRRFGTRSTSFVTNSLALSHASFPKRTRNVWHIRYIDWPDHGCPEVSGFLGFMDEIESVRRHDDGSRSAPTIVHCSAGVGRSGVTILCDVMIHALDRNLDLDVPKVLARLRHQRMLIVQTLAQYKFVYTVLVQYLKNSRLI